MKLFVLALKIYSFFEIVIISRQQHSSVKKGEVVVLCHELNTCNILVLPKKQSKNNGETCVFHIVPTILVDYLAKIGLRIYIVLPIDFI